MTETPGTEQAAPEKPADPCTEQPVPEKPAEPLKFLADKGLGLLGLLAAAAYALSRPLYDAFYAPLGLRPEDLGLSQVEMISRGASSVLVIVLLFAVPIMLGVVLYHSLRMRPLILQAAVLVSLAALSSLLLNGEPEVTVSRAAGVFIGLSPYIALLLLLLFNRSGRRSYRQVFFPSAPRLVPWLLVCSAMGVALFYLSLFGWTAARNAGERFLQTGHIDRSWWSDFLNIRADQVSITPLGQDRLNICDGRHDGYLLGRPDGAVFVLLVPSNETAADPSAVVRLSNEDYSIVVQENAVACKASSDTKTN